MECPNCNYHNIEGADSCKACQFVFKRQEEPQTVSPINQDSSNVFVPSLDQKREPILAAVLSFILPGLGQAYNEQRGKGYLFVYSLILFGILRIPFLSFIIWAYNIYDAYNDANRANSGELMLYSSAGRSVLKFILVLLLSFPVMIIIVIFLRFLGMIGPSVGTCPIRR